MVDENTGKKIVRRTRLEDADGTPVGTAAAPVRVGGLATEGNHVTQNRTVSVAPTAPKYPGRRENYPAPSNRVSCWG
ncbi:hypothetical protein SBV1_1690005 [Verrucomicrobia bacterium]|nr:hypothetical protein SBV1_1690005 [Verrucomicrobiota bacterium]